MYDPKSLKRERRGANNSLYLQSGSLRLDGRRLVHLLCPLSLSPPNHINVTHTSNLTHSRTTSVALKFAIGSSRLTRFTDSSPATIGASVIASERQGTQLLSESGLRSCWLKMLGSPSPDAKQGMVVLQKTIT